MTPVKSIPITTLHDTNVTGDLFFTVGLYNPTGGAQLTSPQSTLVTDHDADAGIFFSYQRRLRLPHRQLRSLFLVACSNPNVEPVSCITPPVVVRPSHRHRLYRHEWNAHRLEWHAIAPSFRCRFSLNNSRAGVNRTFHLSRSQSAAAAGCLLPPSTETITIVGTNTPPGLSFSTPIIISGFWGTTNADNTTSAAEPNDPPIAGQPAQAPVWFEWTAPPGGNGEVTLDTIGSVDVNGVKLDTVLGVFTGTSPGNLNSGGRQ